MPQARASSAEILPTPWVRFSQMVLPVRSDSNSSTRFGMASVNSRSLASHSLVTSWLEPPTRVNEVVSRAPQRSSTRS